VASTTQCGPVAEIEMRNTRPGISPIIGQDTQAERESPCFPSIGNALSASGATTFVRTNRPLTEPRHRPAKSTGHDKVNRWIAGSLIVVAAG